MSKPEDFVGKAGDNARILFHSVPDILKGDTDPEERCWLFTGHHGTGKTTLAKALAMELAGNWLEVEYLNGQSCTIEIVRHWSANRPYAPMFGRMKVKVIDEVDATSLAALNEMRTYLGELSENTVTYLSRS